MASDAVGSERVSKVVGYKLEKGNFQTTSPNLPQRVALLGEANVANQGTLDIAAWQMTSAQEAGNRYGFGSPIYHAARILLPSSGVGIGGIPVIVYPQAEAAGAVQKVITVTPVGTATGNGTHTVIIAGRRGIDGINYDINIVSGDTPTQITQKIEDAVSLVTGSPVIADSFDYDITLTTKWAGLTANDLTVTVDTNDTALGITYAVVTDTPGSATPSVQAGLDLFQANWNTLVLNSYGAVTSVMDALEAFNGIPDPTNPTGRYSGTIFKPFIALTGSILDDPTTITDSRLNDVTIAICPAPLSPAFGFEAAANQCVLEARQAQDNPQLDTSGSTYPDMPVPSDGDIGSMAVYNNRDAFVKKGCSTVQLNANRYEVVDFVTTYHPVGENPPQFRWVRILMIDFNVKYSYFLQEQINLVDHVIAADADDVTASKVVKPKTWTQVVFQLATDLGKRGLIADVAFTQDSISVVISGTNPTRLETTFSYKRTSMARISSTTVTVGFLFGE